MEYLTKNPAIDSPHRKELQDGGQKANIPALKHWVYKLIRGLTQMNSGQEKYKDKHKDYINFNDLDMVINSIAIEATALVLSGELEKIIEDGDGKDGLNKMVLTFDVLEASKNEKERKKRQSNDKK